MRLTPSSRWDVRFGLRSAGREDTYAGYYNYDAFRGFASAERKLGRSGAVQLHVSMRDLDYDHATIVTQDSTEAFLGRDMTRFIGRYDHAIAPGLNAYFEAGAERTDSIDPLWKQDRDWGMVGVRFGGCSPRPACR